ncbi:hypothetical protein IQ255_14820 [Pleurocapsales cyanobacterium LEGE 10410]|nr:hypothetical protein [Pleurocapsales cyanobacterium LEGE 10410]
MANILYRVNAGGAEVAAVDGSLPWSADTVETNSPYLADPGSNSVISFPPVEPGVTTTVVPGPIFDTLRYDLAGGSPMQWAFAVPQPGLYEVRLYGGEGFVGASAPGGRVFDVAVEGAVPTSFDDIDYSAQFGYQNGGVVSTIATVNDGTLNLEFGHGVENPFVSGIEIVQLDDTPEENSDIILYRINAGGGQVAAVDGGIPWSADTTETNSPYLVDPGSNNTASFPPVEPGAQLTGVPGPIFDSERWDNVGGSEMQWAFDVPQAGLYEVRLYLGNGFEGTINPGQRVFDVAVEGAVPISFDNIDVSQQFGHLVGGVVSSTVTVNDGILNLEFIHGVQNPLVNAIEIVQLADEPIVEPIV